MFACLLYDDIRESILEHVFKNEVTNPPMSDSEKFTLDEIETS